MVCPDSKQTHKTKRFLSLGMTVEKVHNHTITHLLHYIWSSCNLVGEDELRKPAPLPRAEILQGGRRQTWHDSKNKRLHTEGSNAGAERRTS